MQSMVRLVIGKTSALRRDTAGDHHRVLDPAEAEDSENNRAQERGHRKAKARGKDKVGESSLKRSFPFTKFTVLILKKEHLTWTTPLGWTVLDCGAAKSFAGGDPAAV